MQPRNSTFLRALLRQPVERTPVWIMRQAGRYLPEYRVTRAKAGSFMQLCKTPELACEVTLQPLARFPLDAAIIFSDILTIPDAMGLGLSFQTGEGPCFEHPIRTAQDIARLGIPDPNDDLNYVMEAIRLTLSELDNKLPLIGFAGSPWTLACYMVEGSGSKTFSQIKALMYAQPELLHQLLTILAKSVVAYLNAQIEAGVHAVMLFDTWGGLLSTRDYQDFSLYYMAQIVADLKRQSTHVPVILFTKGGGQWLNLQAQSGCDALGVDWTIDLKTARQQVGDQVALQGNLDPAALYAAPERIRAEVANILASYGSGHGHIFNLGHGIYPDVPVEHVAALVDAVHDLSSVYHTR
jgi:uroporphyrinogen decarboxylase